MSKPDEPQKPIKDESMTHPVASAWRAPLKEIVKAFAQGDYTPEGIQSVGSVSGAVANQVRDYMSSYGETLTDLPDETWETSVSQWMGAHWDVLVDLWTHESGKSDLVLSARVFEVEDGFRIEIDSVHIP